MTTRELEQGLSPRPKRFAAIQFPEARKPSRPLRFVVKNFACITALPASDVSSVDGFEPFV